MLEILTLQPYFIRLGGGLICKVIGMDSGMMGTIMMVMVLMGMGLSVFHLIAELIARGRYVEFLAGRDEVIRELYSAPQQTAAANFTAANATPAAAPTGAA
jgi:hypothetical protein